MHLKSIRTVEPPRLAPEVVVEQEERIAPESEVSMQASGPPSFHGGASTGPVLHTPTRAMNMVQQQLYNQEMTPNEQRHYNSQTPPTHVMAHLSPSPATVNQHVL